MYLLEENDEYDWNFESMFDTHCDCSHVYDRKPSDEADDTRWTVGDDYL